MKQSKQAIYALHRGDASTAKRNISSSERIIKKDLMPITQQFPALRFLGRERSRSRLSPDAFLFGGSSFFFKKPWESSAFLSLPYSSSLSLCCAVLLRRGVFRSALLLLLLRCRAVRGSARRMGRGADFLFFRIAEASASISRLQIDSPSRRISRRLDGLHWRAQQVRAKRRSLPSALSLSLSLSCPLSTLARAAAPPRERKAEEHREVDTHRNLRKEEEEDSRVCS